MGMAYPGYLFVLLVFALKLDPVISNKKQTGFIVSLGNTDYDKAYQLALNEVELNIENGVFIAGAGWTQLWTRDTSYAVELGAGLLHPHMSQISLRKSTESYKGSHNIVWLQDSCGHFGGFPDLSDAIVGVRGAWYIYLITGDRQWLKWSYEVTRKTLVRAEDHVYDPKTGLFKGCSSFMESNGGYPQRFRLLGKLVGKTRALSTNLLHFAGYDMAAQMARELKQNQTEIKMLEDKAGTLRKQIRSQMWLKDRGYYSYVMDENDELMEQMEGLGESLALLDGFETDPFRIQSIFNNTYRTPRGLPCLWPRFNNTIRDKFDSYHNGRIWPFVQGYWGLAAARHGRVDVFTEELANMMRLGQQTFAEYYELDGSFDKQRSRQLWSDAGFVGMIYHGVFGMTFSVEGITFAPVVPVGLFAETISLRKATYRNMTIDIEITGSGMHVSSCEVNGKPVERPFLNAQNTGNYTVVMNLSSKSENDKPVKQNSQPGPEISTSTIPPSKSEPSVQVSKETSTNTPNQTRNSPNDDISSLSATLAASDLLATELMRTLFTDYMNQEKMIPSPLLNGVLTLLGLLLMILRALWWRFRRP